MAAGLNFWSITYMQVVIGMEPFDAQVSFIFIMITALIPGIVVGSSLVDYFGGYKENGMKNALALGAAYATAGNIFGVLMSFTMDETAFIIYCWFLFFFGIPVMVISAGVLITCVPKPAKNSASAVYNVFANVVGLSLAPYVAGHVMELYSDRK